MIHLLDILAGRRSASRSARRAFREPPYVHVEKRKNLGIFGCILYAVVLATILLRIQSAVCCQLWAVLRVPYRERMTDQSFLSARITAQRIPSSPFFSFFFFFSSVPPVVKGNDGERVRPTAASVLIHGLASSRRSCGQNPKRLCKTV